MKKFIDIDFLPGGGYVGIGKPGIVMGSSKLYCFAQTGIQLRLAKASASVASYAAVTVANGYDTQTMTLSFRFSNRVYADVTEFARTLARRTMAAYESVKEGGTTGTLTVDVYDGSDVLIGQWSISVVWCGGLDRAFSPYSALSYIAPDTIRLPTGTQYDGYLQACVPAIDKYEDATTTVALLDGTGVTAVSDSFENTCQPVKICVSYKIGFIDTESTRTRLVFESCTGDKILLVWWSVEAGGYKSYLADIVSVSESVSEKQAVNIGFEYSDSASMSPVLSARFPSLSHNDYMYVRDILCSDEIITHNDEIQLAGSLATGVDRRARVSGGGEEWKLTDNKDFNFTLIFEEVTSW